MSPHNTHFPDDPWTLDTLYNERPDLLAKKKEVERSNRLHSMTPRERMFVKEWGIYSGTGYIGIDIGKRTDNTAIVIMKPYEPLPERDDGLCEYHVPMVRRVPLDTPYPDIVRGIERLNRQLISSNLYDDLVYVIDAGGVGESVIDALREKMPNGNIIRCYITGGQKVSIDDWTGAISLPKPLMASTMIMLFESERIHITSKDLRSEIEEMETELYQYELKVNAQTRNDQYGAFKSGAHDDLASALGMCAWYAEQNEGASGNVEIW